MVYNEVVAAERRNRDVMRVRYEVEVRNNPLNFDCWLAYLELEESASANKTRIRELCRRAVANVPPVPEKRRWRRYVDLWIFLAGYEERHGGLAQAREVYQQCLTLIPHDKFSIAHVWLVAAWTEFRHGNPKRARKILARGIRLAPKPKMFRNCIELEMDLGNWNLCRKLFDKYLTWKPQNWECWVKYAEFEGALGETHRARAIFELGISQHEEMVHKVESSGRLWDSYIEFEISQGEFERTRKLYERLLWETEQNLTVWIRYARFETQENHSVEHARRVFSRAADCFRIRKGNEEKLGVLRQNWLDMEASFGELGDVSLVHSKLPK